MKRPAQNDLERVVPAATKKLLLQMKRRTFLKSTAAAAIAISTADFLPAQTTTQKSRNPKAFSEKHWRVVKTIQQHLWPDDGNGPSVDEINAAGYLQTVVLDKKMDPEHTAFIRNGIVWVDEEAVELGRESTLDFSGQELEKLLRHVASFGWGESWLSVILLYIFEALLADPLYGGNPDGIGWKWLNHYPGYPRPNEKNKYKPDIS